jgi:hypothetical protein
MSNNIYYLKTKLKISSPYTGSSKFPFFHKLSIGDIVEVKTPLFMFSTGYANDMTMEIISGKFVGESFTCTHGHFRKYFSKLDFCEV